MTRRKIGLLLGSASALGAIATSSAVFAQTCSFPPGSVQASTEEDGIKYEMVKPCYRYKGSNVACEVLLTNTSSEEIEVNFYQTDTVLIDNEGTGYKDAKLSLAGAESSYTTKGALKQGIPTKLIVVFPNAAKTTKKLVLLQLHRRDLMPNTRVGIRNPGYKAGK